MTTNNLLTSLPASLGCCILSSWLSMKWLGKLDVAHCSHCDRSKFLDLLTRMEAVRFSEPTNANPICRLRWLIDRLVPCSSLSFVSRAPLSVADASVLNTFVKLRASDLQQVHIASTDKNIDAILRVVATSKCSLSALSILPTEEISGTPVWDAPIGPILSNSANILTGINVISPVKWKNHFAPGLHLPALQKIEITTDSDRDLISICNACPHLTEIILRDPWCSNVGFAAIGQHCPDLEALTVACDNVNSVRNCDQGITAIDKACRKLRYLNLAMCTNLSDIGLSAVATHCTQLQELVISHNNNITDDPLIALAHSANSGTLQALTIHSCRTVTGCGILAIATYCMNLHSLDLRVVDLEPVYNLMVIIPHLSNVRKLLLYFNVVDDAMLQLIAQHMPQLQHLDITPKGSPAFTTTGLQCVMEKCGQLQSMMLGYDIATVGKFTNFLRTMRPTLVVTPAYPSA